MKFNHQIAVLRNPTAETAGNGGDKIVLTNISYEMFCALKPEQQDGVFKKFSTRVTGLKAEAKDVKTESKYAAIALAGLEVRVKKGIDAGVYASTFTVSDLYKQITGEKPPGHVYSLKCAFVNYVLSGKILEADYLGNRNNCLEIAQRIADACIEFNLPDGLQNEAVTRAASELKARNENEAKVLRGILASVKPAKVMTAEEAIDLVEQIFAAGHFGMCVSHTVTDLVKTAPENLQRETTVALLNGALNIEKYVGTEMVNACAEQSTQDGPDMQTGEAPKAPELETALTE